MAKYVPTVPFPEEDRAPFNASFSRPTRVHTANSMSICSSIFADSPWVFLWAGFECVEALGRIICLQCFDVVGWAVGRAPGL